jgi:transcriptional regulator with XRE-family HTH domain
MEREDLIKSPEYWTTKIQLDLFNQMEIFMSENNLNRTKLSELLGVSKGYLSQVLSGDYDHRISKLVELSLAIGMVPQVEFLDLKKIVYQDKRTHCFNEYNVVFMPESKPENEDHLIKVG